MCDKTASYIPGNRNQSDYEKTYLNNYSVFSVSTRLNMITPSLLESNIKTVFKYFKKIGEKRVLLSVGTFNIFYAKIISMTDRRWEFSLHEMCIGGEGSLRLYEDHLESIQKDERFVICGKENKARKINSLYTHIESGSNKKLVIEVEPLENNPIQPVGVDLALDEDGDLLIENGDIKLVEGEAAYFQKILLTLGSSFEEALIRKNSCERDRDPRNYSLVGLFYRKFRDHKNISLFEELVKIELLRLSRVTYFNSDISCFDRMGAPLVLTKSSDDRLSEEDKIIPPLGFLRSINKIELAGIENDRIKLRCDILIEKYGNVKKDIKVFVGP